MGLIFFWIVDGVGFKVWGEELPQLARRVRQIEGIRNYVGELGTIFIYLKFQTIMMLDYLWVSNLTLWVCVMR